MHMKNNKIQIIGFGFFITGLFILVGVMSHFTASFKKDDPNNQLATVQSADLNTKKQNTVSFDTDLSTNDSKHSENNTLDIPAIAEKVLQKIGEETKKDI